MRTARTLRACSTLATATLAATAAAQSPGPLFSNASPDPAAPALATGATTAAGTIAPPGFIWSEAQALSTTSANAVIGLSAHAFGGGTGSYRFADDLVVPAGGRWRADAISLYAYQTGAPLPPGMAPFAAVNLRVWRGSPAAGGTLIFGDTATNRLATASGTGILRVMSTIASPIGGPADTSRHVWRLDVTLGEPGGDGALVLGPGTYWFDWQIVPADGQGPVFVPPVTKPGVLGEPGWNALQFKPGLGWSAVVDPGKPDSLPDRALDVPFIVHGLNLCPTDFNFDGTVDPDDLADYIAGYFSAPPHPRADFNGDEVVDPDDLADFIAFFFAGC